MKRTQQELKNINDILLAIIQENIEYKLAKTATSIKLNDEDLNDLLNTIKPHCTTVYNSLSIDDHELIWSKHGVEAHLAYDYYYVDILNLDETQFNYIHEIISNTDCCNE